MNDQLTLFAEIDEKEIRSLVVKELIEYKALKVQTENIQERIEANATNLYPSVRKVNPLNELKVRQMERALNNGLNEEERLIIQKKYLSGVKVKDMHLIMELGLGRDRYYETKRSAISVIATALGII